jgi:integrase
MPFRTAANVARLTLPEDKPEVFHFDDQGTGLAVRIQRSGRPVLVVWYTTTGKRKRITLGTVASIPLSEARRRAGEIVATAREGRDPAAERRQAKAPGPEALTVGGLLARYLREAEKCQRPRTLVETRRHLQKHALPLHSLPAAELTRREVSSLLLDLAAASGRVAANRSRASLSSAYAWGMRAGLVDHNPTIGTVRADERARERVLSVPELAAIWRATSRLDYHDRITRLLILLGARRGEVGGMAEAELDRERGLWTLPAERSKNGRPHEVPLPRQALALLPQSGNPYLFRRGGKAPFTSWSRSKGQLDERISCDCGGPMPRWHLHDLRRSAVTHMAELGIAPHIIEAIVGHISGHKSGVAGNEKVSALQAWADWIEGAIEEVSQSLGK